MKYLTLTEVNLSPALIRDAGSQPTGGLDKPKPSQIDQSNMGISDVASNIKSI